MYNVQFDEGENDNDEDDDFLTTFTDSHFQNRIYCIIYNRGKEKKMRCTCVYDTLYALKKKNC